MWGRKRAVELEERIDAALAEIRAEIEELTKRVEEYPHQEEILDMQAATMKGAERINALMARLRKREIAEIAPSPDHESNGNGLSLGLEEGSDPKAELRRRAAQLRGRR